MYTSEKIKRGIKFITRYIELKYLAQAFCVYLIPVLDSFLVRSIIIYGNAFHKAWTFGLCTPVVCAMRINGKCYSYLIHYDLELHCLV